MQLILLLLSGLGLTTAVRWRSTRIVGGAPTDVESYPYMVNMQYGFLGIWWHQACGGSLITTTSVLSAAHCYDGDAASSWRARVGTSQAAGGGRALAVRRLLAHALFNATSMANDVAIVKLSSPATLSASVGLASIAGPNYQLPDGAGVFVVGWGTLSSGGDSPEQLQHVELNVINQSLCAERYKFLQNVPGYDDWPDIDAGMLCLGILDEGGKDACQGDSGGPAARGGTVVGITSWGLGCADDFFPGVNTRVSYYSDWIVSNA